MRREGDSRFALIHTLSTHKRREKERSLFLKNPCATKTANISSLDWQFRSKPASLLLPIHTAIMHRGADTHNGKRNKFHARRPAQPHFPYQPGSAEGASRPKITFVILIAFPIELTGRKTRYELPPRAVISAIRPVHNPPSPFVSFSFSALLFPPASLLISRRRTVETTFGARWRGRI